MEISTLLSRFYKPVLLSILVLGIAQTASSYAALASQSGPRYEKNEPTDEDFDPDKLVDFN